MQCRFLYLFCLLWLGSFGLSGQSNEGTEFWFGFMEHRDVMNNVKVAMITSKFNTSGTISIPNRSWSVDYTVGANEVKLITLPLYVENIGSEDIDNTGIQVVSEEPVSLYLHQYHQWRSEASVVLPVSSQGNQYYTMSYDGVSNDGNEYFSEFLVVAIEDETKIEITVNDATKGGRSKGETFEIELNRGETYQVQAARASSDLSGSYIKGNKKISVFSGNNWTEVPTGCSARDNLTEQMFSLEFWGKQMVTVPSAGMPYDIFRIMASENNTQVTIASHNDLRSISLNRGEFQEIRLSEASSITSTKPIQVGQFLIGQGCSGYGIGDPSMLMLNSVVQTRDTVTLFNSSLQNIEKNFINIIALTSDVPLITLDGKELPGFAEIGTVGPDELYSYITIPVFAGAHTIISEGCGVIASAYGYGEAESYAYSGGASFNSINANPIPDGGCLNDTVFFDAGLPEERYTFLWDLGDGNLRTEKEFEVYYDELGSYPTQVTITDECLGTSETYSKDLLITLRQAVEAVGDTAICALESFTLGASDVENATYLWKGPGEFISKFQSPSVSIATTDLQGSYEVIGIVSGCESFPAIVDITIHPLPDPVFEQDSFYCNRREETVISAGDFSSYKWHDNSTSSEITVENEGIYRVTVSNEFGCTESSAVYMRDRCPTEIYIPNAFSPNDDGVNDVWQIYGHDISSFDLKIMDRWGEVMFTSTDENLAWDGKLLGRPVASDVYFFSLKIEGITDEGENYKEDVFGTISILR